MEYPLSNWQQPFRTGRLVQPPLVRFEALAAMLSEPLAAVGTMPL